jgi:glycosyltransferase involved in cell wall biosynthesis
MAASDALLMCSRNEAFGMVTVEALQAGLPVIGYKLGGTAEILGADPPSGTLVDPTPAAMARAICLFAANRQALTEAAEHAAEAGRHWSHKRRDDDFLDVIETVGSGASGGDLQC